MTTDTLSEPQYSPKPTRVRDAIMKSQEPAFRIVELIVIGAALAYNVWINANQVPGLKDALSDVKKDVAVLQTNFSNIQQSLDRIENKLDK